jgi:hypothetical protein
MVKLVGHVEGIKKLRNAHNILVGISVECKDLGPRTTLKPNEKYCVMVWNGSGGSTGLNGGNMKWASEVENLSISGPSYIHPPPLLQSSTIDTVYFQPADLSIVRAKGHDKCHTLNHDVDKSARASGPGHSTTLSQLLYG